MDSRGSLNGDEKRKPDVSRFLEAVETLAASENKLAEIHKERSDALREIRLFFMQRGMDEDEGDRS